MSQPPALAAYRVSYETSLPDNIAARLGQVIVKFALLERLANVVLFRLAGVHDAIGRLTLGTAHIEDQLLKAEELLTLFNSRVNFDFKKNVKILRELRLERDLLAHANWLVFEEHLCVVDTQGRWNLGVAAPRIKKRGVPTTRRIDVGVLTSLARDLDGQRTQLQRLLAQVQALPASSRRIPDELRHLKGHDQDQNQT